MNIVIYDKLYYYYNMHSTYIIKALAH